MSTHSMHVKRCRVIGCTFPSCMDGNPHFCRNCYNTDSTHFSSNCHYVNGKASVKTILNPNINTVKSISIHPNTVKSIQPISNPVKSIQSVSNTVKSVHLIYNPVKSVHTISNTVNNIHLNWIVDGTYTSAIKAGTMTILFHKNNELNVLTAFRGCGLPGKNTLTTSGGSIEASDHVHGYDAGVIAAIRETREEFGINVEPKNIFYQRNYDRFCNVFAYIPDFHSDMVNGPASIYRDEITPAKGITIENYFSNNTDGISNVWENLIYSVPIKVLFDNHTIMSESHMKQLYFKLRELRKKGVLDSLSFLYSIKI